MNSYKFRMSSEDALKFYHEEDVNDVHNGARFVAKIYSGEWRWGSTYQLVIQDMLTERYFETFVNEQSGDHWYLSLENEDVIDFDQVVPVEVVTTKYVKAEYANS